MLLFESSCPSCGDPNAYQGLNSCECPNSKCKFFTQRQLDDEVKAGRVADPRSKKYFIEFFPATCDPAKINRYKTSAKKHGIDFEYFALDMSGYGGPVDEGGFKISGTKERLRHWLIDNGFGHDEYYVDSAEEDVGDPVGDHAFSVLNTT